MSDSEDNDLEKVGLFKDGPYDTDVTLYRPDIETLMGRDKDKEEDRLDGPYPVVPGFKIKAATNDWPFSPFMYLYEDGKDVYEDPGSAIRRYRMEEATKNVSDNPFVPPMGGRDMNGSGTYYGTFIDEMEAFSPEVRDKEQEPEMLPNFYTNPGKKGTGYGYVDVGLSPYPGRDNGEEDPFFDSMEALAEANEAHRLAVISKDAFMPSGNSKPFFDPNPYYNDRDPDGEIETYDLDRLGTDRGGGDGEVDLPPFVPAGVTKKINGNKDVLEPLEKFPEYDPSDPYEDPPTNTFRQGKPVYEEKKPWRPPMHKKTRQTRSIINYNVGMRVNATNFHRFI